MTTRRLVKISKPLLDEFGQYQYKLTYEDDDQTVESKELMREDVICEFWFTGRKAMETNSDRIWYQDVVYLIRMDDGTIEEALPGEIVVLDVIEQEEKEM